MEDNLYNQASAHFNKGEYEEVIKTFLQSNAHLSDKEKALLREAKKQVTEQYLFLIKEYIQQKKYNQARKLQEEYVSKHNFDDRIAGIKITANATNKLSTKEAKSTVAQTERTKKKSVAPLFALLGFGLVALTVVAALFIWNDDKEDYISMIENQPEREVQHPYNNTSGTNTDEHNTPDSQKQENEVTLKTYHNPRFDYSILYPSSFKDIRESDNGDGCRFSKDDNTYLTVFGAYNSLNETLEDRYNEYKVNSPVYCRLKNNWFVVSDYTKDGDIFYLKTALKNDVFITAILYFPKDEKEYYSPLLTKMFANFPTLRKNATSK